MWPRLDTRPAHAPGRVLLIHPGALGDLVQALPAFGAVRATYPQARVTLVVGDDLAAFAAGFDLFDRVEPFDVAAAYRGSAAARLAVLARLCARLRAASPDAVGVFKGAPSYAVLAAASGASVRVGLARGWGARLLTTPIAIDPGAHHEDRFLAVAHALGATPDGADPPRWPAVALPAAFVAVRAFAEYPAFVAVAPGGARNAKQDYAPKRWPARHFAEAVRLVRATHHVVPVLLGGSGDRDEAEQFRVALGPGVAIVDLVARTSVPEARAVIAACDAYLGNDSGLMHVAGTTTTPIVAVFGPTDPRVLAPRGRHVYTPWHPSRRTACVDERTGQVAPCSEICCMDRVTPAEVADALDAALHAARHAGRDVVRRARDGAAGQPAVAGGGT